MGSHRKLLLQNHRLLRHALRPKQLRPHPKVNRDPSLPQIHPQQPRLRRNLQNDHPQVQDQRAHRNYLLKPQIIQNQVANYHKHSNSPDQKMRNEYIMNLCQNRQLELARIN